MGRKPLGMKVIPVRLPPDVIARLDAIAGNYGRPAAIREAVEEWLSKRDKP